MRTIRKKKTAKKVYTELEEKLKKNQEVISKSGYMEKMSPSIFKSY